MRLRLPFADTEDFDERGGADRTLADAVIRATRIWRSQDGPDLVEDQARPARVVFVLLDGRRAASSAAERKLLHGRPSQGLLVRERHPNVV